MSQYDFQCLKFDVLELNPAGMLPAENTERHILFIKNSISSHLSAIINLTVNVMRYSMILMSLRKKGISQWYPVCQPTHTLTLIWVAV